MSGTARGLELLFKTVEGKIKCKSDCLVVLIHWILSYKNDFAALGIGGNGPLTEDEKNRELCGDLLPDDWNECDYYSLRYLKNDQLFVLSGIKSDDIFIMNLLEHNLKSPKLIKVYTTHIDVQDSVRNLNEKYKTMMPNYEILIERIQCDFFGNSLEKNLRQNNDLDEYFFRYTPPNSRILSPRIRHDIGRRDLNPIGLGEPGNLYPQPPMYGVNRPPSVPRARYDPFNRNIEHDEFPFPYI